MKKLKDRLVALSCILILAAVTYHYLWGRHRYLVTAYCDCPICVNVPKYQDGKFASGRKVFWGGVAADSRISFGSKVELVPLWPTDFWDIEHILDNRTRFRVEDRGGKIKGHHIDIFIPAYMGGHATAMKWGRRRMRIRLNGELAD